MSDPIFDPSFITDEKLREEAAEHLGRMATYGDAAVSFLTIGDDKGAEYSIKSAGSHLKHAVGIFAELKQRVMTQRKEETYALAKPATRRPIRTEQARRDGDEGAGRGGIKAEAETATG